MKTFCLFFNMLLFCLIISSFSGLSQNLIVFEDKFDRDSKFVSMQREDKSSVIKVENGKLKFQINDFHNCLITIPLDIDMQTNFSIECDLTHVEGGATYGYGIVLFGSDDLNYAFLNIRADGFQRSGWVVDGEIEKNSYWLDTYTNFNNTKQLLNPGNSKNHLKIIKRGSSLSCEMNGEKRWTFLKKLKNKKGKRFGFDVKGEQTIYFENFIIKQIK